jgi:phosphomannomutase
VPPDNVLRIELTDSTRVMIRPSGTEPKLKFYLDARGESRADAEAKVASVDAALRALVA